MKYISRTHLKILMVMVVILGILLLLGEHYSRDGFSNQTGATGTMVGADPENLLSGSGMPQTQLQMKSSNFIIRPGQSKLTYAEALDLYKNNVLQFNENCELSSSNRSFNLNNEIMIDNRSSKPSTFSVGSASVVIGPYDFGFLILKEKGTAVPVSCGTRTNVAQLTVQ